MKAMSQFHFVGAPDAGNAITESRRRQN